MKNVILSLFLLSLLLGCNQNEASADADRAIAISLPAKMSANDESANYDMAADTTAVAVEMLEPPKSAPDQEETIATKIIKNANLRFETDDLEKTYQQIQIEIKKFKATVQNDSEGKEYNEITKNLTIRIPSQHFDAFIENISKGVPYFDTKEISSEDVTEEYIDVASRIKTKKILEARYLELLKKATKVSEMMEVEKQLSEIREEIEAKEGRLKYLKNRVALSTVHLSFYKTLAHESGARVSYGTKMGNAIKSGFNGISSFFIWVIEVWPFIVILVALIYVIRKRIRRKKNKNEDTPEI